MKSALLSLFAAVASASDASASQQRQAGLNMDYMKGVNLGGWLILENWMFPEFMGGWLGYPDDEWGVVGARGGPESQEAIDFMTNHWDTFITEDDVDEMQAFGFTHIRIPVGWWIVDYDPADGFVDGGLFYMERLLSWLGARGMHAVIDVHAMPGCQTPFQSFTGRSCDYPGFFYEQNNLERGKQMLLDLSEIIVGYENSTDPNMHDVVVGLELVNEPSEQVTELNKQFCEDMVPRIREILPASKYALLLSFMENPLRITPWMENLINTGAAGWENIIYDKHIYHAYGDNDGNQPWTLEMDSCKTCCRDPVRLEPLKNLNTVIGEWALNTDTGDDHEKSPEFLREYWALQLSLWERETVGYFFWTWKLGPNPGNPDYHLNFDMQKLTSILPKMDDVEISGLCDTDVPTWRSPLNLAECPAFDVNSVQYNSECYWQTAPPPTNPPHTGPPTPAPPTNPPTSPPPPGECVALFEQCGGVDYTGITTCCEGRCDPIGDIWYSQCLP